MGGTSESERGEAGGTVPELNRVELEAKYSEESSALADEEIAILLSGWLSGGKTEANLQNRYWVLAQMMDLFCVQDHLKTNSPNINILNYIRILYYSKLLVTCL